MPRRDHARRCHSQWAGSLTGHVRPRRQRRIGARLAATSESTQESKTVTSPSSLGQATRCALALAAAASFTGCASVRDNDWKVEPIYRIGSGSGKNQPALPADAVSAQGYATLARQYEFEGRWALAVDTWRKAVAAQPANADMHTSMGVAMTRAQHLQQAVQAFRDAVALLPDNARALNNLGFALLLDGRDAEAAVVLQQAVKRDPGYALAQSNFAEAERRVQLAMSRELTDGAPATAVALMLKSQKAGPEAPHLSMPAATAPSNVALAQPVAAVPETVAPERPVLDVIQAPTVPALQRVEAAPLAGDTQAAPTSAAVASDEGFLGRLETPASLTRAPVTAATAQLSTAPAVPAHPAEPLASAAFLGRLSGPDALQPATSQPLVAATVPTVAAVEPVAPSAPGFLGRLTTPDVASTPVASMNSELAAVTAATPLPSAGFLGRLSTPAALSPAVRASVATMAPVADQAVSEVSAQQTGFLGVLTTPARLTSVPAPAVSVATERVESDRWVPASSAASLQPAVLRDGQAAGHWLARSLGARHEARIAQADQVATNPDFSHLQARVAIVNGMGLQGAAAGVRTLLQSQGLAAAGLQNQRPFRQAITEVRYLRGHAEEAQQLADALPDGAVLIELAAAEDARYDVRIVLGHDRAEQLARCLDGQCGAGSTRGAERMAAVGTPGR